MKAISELVKVLRDADTDEKMKNLLEGLLTSSEIEELRQRMEIVRLLKKGVAQHEIAKRLGIGVATVTRGSKEIKEGRFRYI